MIGFVVSACGFGRGGTETVIGDNAGDGRLDCVEGEFPRGAEIEVFADSEEGVVALALQTWTEQGADIVALPVDGAWSAVLDDRDLALAYPERDGSGGWTVHDVSTCGPAVSGPAVIDGELDCANDYSWGKVGSIDPAVPGFPTIEEAQQAALDPYLDGSGGSIATVGNGLASLVVDDREQVAVVAEEAEAGGWIVAGIVGCEGYER